MNDTAKLQLAVIEDFIGKELVYMEEEGIEASPVLDLLKQAAVDAGLGKVLTEEEVDKLALDYYNATANDMTGDTDMADWLEEELMETLA